MQASATDCMAALTLMYIYVTDSVQYKYRKYVIMVIFLFYYHVDITICIWHKNGLKLQQ